MSIFNRNGITIMIFLLFICCGKENLVRNPYLRELTFSVPIDLNLPQFNNLRYAGGSALLPEYGHKGILVFNLNGSTYLAWEASCPHHQPNACSRTEVVGVLTECACENYQYSLATGQLLNPLEGQKTIYSLVSYHVQTQGNRLVISN